jgi:hypothetical protein
MKSPSNVLVVHHHKYKTKSIKQNHSKLFHLCSDTPKEVVEAARENLVIGQAKNSTLYRLSISIKKSAWNQLLRQGAASRGSWRVAGC